MRILGETDTGAVRASNQDCFASRILSDTLGYAVVCDGMGGENGGQVASSMALAAICARLDRELREGMTQEEVRQQLREALAEANQVVYDRAQQEGELRGMGTTAVVAVVEEGVAQIAHVGDSRAYWIQMEEQAATCVTRDHTVVRVLMDRGEITAEEAQQHPQRHYITRAVGVAPRLEPDYVTQPLGPEEYLLLCSDGLYNYLDEGDLPVLLLHCIKEKSALPLIREANMGGGGDNITAVILLPDMGGTQNG